MTFVKDLSKMLNQRGLLCLGVLAVIVVVLVLYNKQLGLSRSQMTNKDQDAGESAPAQPRAPAVTPANPMGMNSGPGSAAGVQTVTGGVPQNCLKQQAANPQDLLPKDSNSGWASASPRGSGELANVNLLKAGHHSGIDTVGGTLRNANLQLRSEPPNPKTQVSPWSNSTIEPDLMRVPLELGCGAQ